MTNRDFDNWSAGADSAAIFGRATRAFVRHITRVDRNPIPTAGIDVIEHGDNANAHTFALSQTLGGRPFTYTGKATVQEMRDAGRALDKLYSSQE